MINDIVFYTYNSLLQLFYCINHFRFGKAASFQLPLNKNANDSSNIWNEHDEERQWRKEIERERSNVRQTRETSMVCLFVC